jgi:hypothetical protein
MSHEPCGVPSSARKRRTSARPWAARGMPLSSNSASSSRNATLSSASALPNSSSSTAQAVTSYHKAIELNAKFLGAKAALEQALRLAALRDKLSAFRKGEDKPTTNTERLALAEACRLLKLHHTVTRLYGDAFAADPKLADDLNAGHRYNAACFASLAAASRSEDAAKLDDKERSRLRQQALDWLRADLPLWAKFLDNGKPADRAVLPKALKHWQQDADLAGLRDKAALARLPAEEQKAIAQLWADVAALLKMAEAPPAKGGKR